jgi:hypothetical protein
VTKKFNSLKDFSRHIEKVVLSEKVYKKATLELIGKFLEDAAKRKFGVYQKDDGLFEGWAQLAESTQQQRVRLGYSPNDPLFRSGETMNSLSHSVSGDSVYNGSTSILMKYFELGTINMPPRPVLGPAMFENRDKIKKIIKMSMVLWLKNQSIKKLGDGYGIL